MTLPHRRVGRGEPLLLVHGYSDSSGTWMALQDRLMERFDVAAPDLPGFGAAPKFPRGHSADEHAFADALDKFVVSLGWQRPHVVGSSMGGLVALVLAARGSARSCLALAPAGQADPLDRVWTSSVFRLGRWARPVLDLTVDRVVAHPAGRTALGLFRQARPWIAEPADMAASIRRVMASPGALRTDRDVTWRGARPGEPRCPTTIAWGSRDWLLPPWHARRWHRVLPDAEVVRLEGLGHLPWCDDVEAVARLVERVANCA